jgi:hypothetical protein
MKTLEQHIEETMNWFDFNKVHKVMTFLNWKWAGEGVPETPIMRQRVREYMKELYAKAAKQKKFNSFLSSGGFMVKYVKNVDKNGSWDYFSVSFQLVDWDTEV